MILAAGAASRFGSPKALAPWGTRHLLAHVVRTAYAAVHERPWVVLGASAPQIEAGLQIDNSPCQLLYHAAWPQGLGASLSFALQQITAQKPNLPALLVMLGDQPAISPEDLQHLLAAWHTDRDRPVAAQFGEHLGAPCIIPRRLFAELLALRADEGARVLLRRLEDTIRVPMPNAEFDVDTPADLQAIWLRCGERSP